MDHVVIFINILILTVGFSVVYQGFHVYRTFRFPAVRVFVLYIGLYNLVMLLTLIAQYLMRNVASLADDGMFVIVAVAMGSVAFPLAALETWFYASTTWHLAGDGCVPRWFTYSYLLICAVWLIGFATGSYRFFAIGDKRFLLGVHAAINISLTALFLLLSLLLIIRARHVPAERQKRIALVFGVFVLTYNCIDASSVVVPAPWGILVVLLSSVAYDAIILLNMSRYVRTYYGPMIGDGELHLGLDRLCEQFHFSTRERDIVEMILKGKSNKEIEQELFISPHTVKNHIYHIFQKAGLNSRGQLVSLVLQNSANGAVRSES
jgi:DNA-binding CsgD family transcriptional regulator